LAVAPSPLKRVFNEGANILRKEVRPLSVFEAITLMLAFAVLIVKLIEYIDKRK